MKQKTKIKLKVETLSKINNTDLADLCNITEQAIEAGGGFGWLKTPHTDVLKKYCKIEEFTLSKWNKKPIKNILSHQKIEIDFWIVKIDGRIESFIKKESLMNYPMPKVLQNFREKFFLC